jgi:hypothetical protein
MYSGPPVIKPHSIIFISSLDLLLAVHLGSLDPLIPYIQYIIYLLCSGLSFALVELHLLSAHLSFSRPLCNVSLLIQFYCFHSVLEKRDGAE